MRSRGDLQKALSKILAEVKASGYKFEDVLPEDMEDHFPAMTDLKTAREYIKEVELREGEVKAENAVLLNKLATAKANPGKEAEEYEMVKVDLQQAHRVISYYQDLSETAERKAAKYERQWKEAATELKFTVKAAKQHEKLEIELSDLRTAHLEMSKQNDDLLEHVGEERQECQKIIDNMKFQCRLLIEAKDKELAVMAAKVAKVEKVEAEDEAFSHAHTELIEMLQTQNSEVETENTELKTENISLRTLNSTLQKQYIDGEAGFEEKLSKQEALYCAVKSEMVPLRQFYDSVCEVLKLYQAVFQNLSDPKVKLFTSLSPGLDQLMTAAADYVDVYRNMHQTLQAGGVVDEAVRNELQIMGNNATEMYNRLTAIHEYVAKLLECLDPEPAVRVTKKPRTGFNAVFNVFFFRAKGE